MRVKKYIQGPVINSGRQLDRELVARRYVFIHNKPQHPGWILSMRYKTIFDLLYSKSLRFANINPNWSEK